LLRRALDESVLVARALSVIARRLGEGCLLAGRRKEAEAAATRALEAAKQSGGHADEAWTMRLLADIAASHPKADVKRAGALYGAALSCAAALGMEPLLARCRLGLGQLHAQAGDRVRARAELEVAVEITGRLDLGLWHRQAQTALSAVSGAELNGAGAQSRAHVRESRRSRTLRGSRRGGS
jgi:hypothetical protein